MPRLSRRRVIAGAGASLTWSGAPDVDARPDLDRPTANKPDPVLAKVAAWRAAYDVREAMIREWQDLENALCEKTKPMPMSLTQAGRSNFPEARVMRALDRQIKNASKKLDRAAGRIALMRPVSAAGALAKIDLGLIVQGPYDWEEYAYALMHGGVEQLRDLL